MLGETPRYSLYQYDNDNSLGIVINKKVTHSGSKTPIYVELYRDFPQIIPRMQKTLF